MKLLSFFSMMVICLSVIGCVKNQGLVSAAWDFTEDVKSQGYSVNGLREGPREFFYPGGQLWARCTYAEGKLNGPLEVRYSNGTLEEKGSYFRGYREGQCTWYFPNGKVYMRGNFVADKNDGMWESFTSDGNLWWRGFFAQGQKHGLWEAWTSGTRVEMGNFSQGLRHGAWNSFYSNGKVHFEGWFDNGVKAGIWREYDEKGHEIRLVNYGNPAPQERGASLLTPDSSKLFQIERELRESLDPTFRLDRAGPFVIASEASKVVTDHFRTYTILWLHDQMMRDFCLIEPPSGTKVYLFQTTESYRYHALKWFGKVADGSAGFATQNALLVDISTGTGTLVHELVHAYLHSDFPFVPIWVDEGLASLFEQSAEVNSSIKGLVNWRLPILKNAIKEKRIVPINVLTMFDKEKFNGAGVELHYAAARYLCYYLQEIGLLHTFYRACRDNFRTDPRCTRTLLQILRKDSLEEVQADWVNFIDNLVDSNVH